MAVLHARSIYAIERPNTTICFRHYRIDESVLSIENGLDNGTMIISLVGILFSFIIEHELRGMRKFRNCMENTTFDDFISGAFLPQFTVRCGVKSDIFSHNFLRTLIDDFVRVRCFVGPTGERWARLRRIT